MLGLPQSAGGDPPRRPPSPFLEALESRFSSGEMSERSLQKSQVSSPS